LYHCAFTAGTASVTNIFAVFTACKKQSFCKRNAVPCKRNAAAIKNVASVLLQVLQNVASVLLKLVKREQVVSVLLQIRRLIAGGHFSPFSTLWLCFYLKRGSEKDEK
jgi:hypothetical protein